MFCKDGVSCVNRIDVDNQLGNLFSHLNNTGLLPKPETTALTFEKHHNVLISNDVVPYDLAKKTLNFLKTVLFDLNAPLINDNDNHPRNICYNYPSKGIPEEYKSRYESPKEFIWEYYKINMYRLTPMNLRAFYGSPLIELIRIILWRWWLNEEINVKNLVYTTIVLQKISKGGHIGMHDDKAIGRRISFVYYLTDEDWSIEDGGLLGVDDITGKIQIPPKFNSMVSWKMKDHVSPLHEVTKINSDKARYALVGFWNDKV